ncbi:MAG: tetratricopeptide repeat protein [Methanolobus sp.]|nr:tetratricopeptide repeat protein [Methanolobus sp.]
MKFLSRIFGTDSTKVNIKRYEKETSKIHTRANLLVEMGRFDEALIAYEQSADMWKKIGDHFSETHDEKMALEAYRKSTEVRSCKGGLYFRLGKYEDALDSVDSLLKICPGNALDWSNRGLALFNLGRHEEAATAFGRALEIDPEFAGAWCSRGSCLIQLGRYEEAIESFDKARENAEIMDFSFPRFTWVSSTSNKELKADISQACYLKGTALSILGRNKEALEAFDEALEARPGYVDAENARKKALSHL